jgi:hypothetical protein
MIINLIVQYYKCDNEARQEEIDFCLSKNLSNEFISSVYLLTEQLIDMSHFPHHEKIKQTVIGERLTFEMAFQHANQQHEDQVWILSNADIYFDGSLVQLNDAKLGDAVFALTRHDIQMDGTWKIVDPAYAHGSQDAWIFKTPIPLDKLYAKFYLGIPGCDNRIAYEFIKAGYKVINPSNKITIYHLDLIRRTNILERDKEYAKLMTEKNINKGLAAPPPYQYYLYPVDQVDPDSFEMYKSYIFNLTRLGIENTAKEQLLYYKSWRGMISNTLNFMVSLLCKQRR